ncbi:MAG: hypothetical protein VB063_06955, partial [Bacteroides graminisolvens]|nr:hypothetical protein [Bacteroides graminisolvens]
NYFSVNLGINISKYKYYLFQKYIIMLHLSVKNSSKCRNTTRFHSCDAYSYSIRATVVVCQQPTQTNMFQ